MAEFPDNMFQLREANQRLQEANQRLTETGAGLTKNAQDFWNRMQLQQQDIEALINAARTKDEQITYLKGILELAHGQLESWKEKARELQTIGKDLENRLSNQTNVSVSPMTDERPWPHVGSIVEVMNPDYAVQNIYFYVLAVGPSTYTWSRSRQTTKLLDGQYLVIGVKQFDSDKPESELRDGVDWDIIRIGIGSATGPDSKFGNYISPEKPLE